jgi:hypothetical protein
MLADVKFNFSIFNRLQYHAGHFSNTLPSAKLLNVGGKPRTGTNPGLEFGQTVRRRRQCNENDIQENKL